MTAVMKFGGTSVADPGTIRQLIDIVAKDMERQTDGSAPVVVVSAMGGVTDALLTAARAAESGDAQQALTIVAAIEDRHRAAARELVQTEERTRLLFALDGVFEELRRLLGALAHLREASPRSLDAIAAAGELASSRLVAAALAAAGCPAAWIDPRQIVVTDANHGAAAPEMDEITKRARAVLEPLSQRGTVPVIGGFAGATASGVTTTLGRGGSDYSAAILGAALDVDEIQIWTDVDGMLTADPRIIADPMIVSRLSFAEASELAYFGAKVLHPSTMLPAMARNIPVRILNSRRPDGHGSVITAEADREPATPAAIACKRGVTVVDITSTRMLMAYGFLRRLFEVFERCRTSVDVVATSEVSVSVTVDDTRRLEEITSALREFAEVSIEPEMAIVCAVGESLRTDPTLFARAITALGRLPLRLVSQAAGRRNVTFVLRDEDVPQAMRRLHEAFFVEATLNRP